MSLCFLFGPYKVCEQMALIRSNYLFPCALTLKWLVQNIYVWRSMPREGSHLQLFRARCGILLYQGKVLLPSILYMLYLLLIKSDAICHFSCDGNCTRTYIDTTRCFACCRRRLVLMVHTLWVDLQTATCTFGRLAVSIFLVLALFFRMRCSNAQQLCQVSYVLNYWVKH